MSRWDIGLVFFSCVFSIIHVWFVTRKVLRILKLSHRCRTIALPQSPVLFFFLCSTQKKVQILIQMLQMLTQAGLLREATNEHQDQGCGEEQKLGPARAGVQWAQQRFTGSSPQNE